MFIYISQCANLKLSYDDEEDETFVMMLFSVITLSMVTCIELDDLIWFSFFLLSSQLCRPIKTTKKLFFYFQLFLFPFFCLETNVSMCKNLHFQSPLPLSSFRICKAMTLMDSAGAGVNTKTKLLFYE